MANIKLWRIEQNVVYKSELTLIPLEKDLEDWIYQDPSLIQDDLLIVGRQLRVANGILDLLAIDSQGIWHIIEIKREKLDDKTIGQTLRYAAWLESVPVYELRQKIEAYFIKNGWSLWDFLREHRRETLNFFENRDIRVCIAGTRKSAFLDQTAHLLNRRGIQTRIVTFQLFEDELGRRTLVRDEVDSSDVPLTIKEDFEADSVLLTHEIENPESVSEKDQRHSLEALFSIADSAGIGVQFKTLFDIATKYHLYPRVYKHCVMYTPAANKNRYLYTVWAKPRVANFIYLELSSKAFVEFFPVSEQDVRTTIGDSGGYNFDAKAVKIFVQQMDALFSKL